MLKEQDIQYGNLVSYHQMCRWNSGMFYKHPALAIYRYYWRVEPNVRFFCDVDYDVFRYMEDHNKTYGFTINLYDDPKSIPTLWPETEKFIAAHPEYIHDNNAMDWLTDKERRPSHNHKANGYSTCHFWSNFEVADMNVWRSQAYEDYFNHLDRAGGFFYERWGDAPVHSIALGLFEDKSRIHWYVLHVRALPPLLIPVNTGFAILAINIFRTLIVQTRQSVGVAKKDSLQMARNSSIRRTAGPTGLNMSAWARHFDHLHISKY